MIRRWLPPGALTFLLCGCSSGESEPGRACVPGTQIECPCPGSGSGAQICNSQGTGYDACFGCGGGAGGTGSGGSAGSGGVATGKRTGLVGLDQGSLSDDQGRFNALGATLMWGAWGFKNDKARLEQNLEYLSQHGFHYVRALGVVGDYDNPDYWDGREIDWRWPDYADVIAGFTDLAYDQYGLRVEWTLIGDGQTTVPNSKDRYALVDTFVAMSQGREQKIILFEIANEAWQNGFSGSAGVDELRALSAYMNQATPILVASSAPAGGDCAGAEQLTTGGVADITSLHFDRDVGQVDGHWRPVWQPWWVWHCPTTLPVAANNEPIGPGASVNSEEDPEKLVAGAVASFVSGLPLHVFHSGAGVRGDQNLWEMAGADAFGNVAQVVPPDIASWQRYDHDDPNAPVRVYADDGGSAVSDALWPELSSPTAGVVQALSAVDQQELFVLLVGVLDHVVVEARSGLTFEVVSPQSGATLYSHSLAAGEQLTLSGAGALVVRGTTN